MSKYIRVSLILLAAIAAIVAIACTGPRSEIYCLKNGHYVKCPKNVEPGSVLTNE